MSSFGATPASAATLQEVSDFGANPSGIKMFLYVPDRVVASPPVLVGVHWCHGNARDYYGGTEFASLADKYGFVVIYPSAVSSDGCWDVHSPASLSHGGGGDSAGIVSMVRYVVEKHRADAGRVYVTGISSGAMMTNVLLGTYPDVFRAGAAFAGVPFSCFAGASSWNGSCAEGKISKTGAQWGDAVRAAHPGYTGQRPRMQLWHGTDDDILRFPNFGEEIKQWTNVLGVSETPSSTEVDVFEKGWVRTRYADDAGRVLVEAVKEQGQPHNLTVMASEALRFFGLDGRAADPLDVEGPNGSADAGGRADAGGSKSDSATSTTRDAASNGGRDAARSSSSGKAGGSVLSGPGDASASDARGSMGASGRSTGTGSTRASGQAGGSARDDQDEGTGSGGADDQDSRAGDGAESSGGCSYPTPGGSIGLASEAWFAACAWMVGRRRRRQRRA